MKRLYMSRGGTHKIIMSNVDRKSTREKRI